MHLQALSTSSCRNTYNTSLLSNYIRQLTCTKLLNFFFGDWELLAGGLQLSVNPMLLVLIPLVVLLLVLVALPVLLVEGECTNINVLPSLIVDLTLPMHKVVLVLALEHGSVRQSNFA